MIDGKHVLGLIPVTLDKTLAGPDHKASLTPDEMKLLITSIRQVEKAMGDSRKAPTPSEMKNREVARKSLVASQPIKMGEPFSPSNLTTKCPGTGISPLYYWEWLEKKADKNYERDRIIH